MFIRLNLPKLSDIKLPKLPDLKGLQKKHKLYLAGGALGALLLAGGITLAVILIGPGTPKILEQPQPEPQEVSKFVKSERFAKLPEEQKVAFVEKILDNEYYDDKYETMFRDTSEEDGKRLGEQMKPVFIKVINKKLDEYFRMKKEEKTAFMDKIIDRLDRAKKRAEAQGKNPGQRQNAMRGRRGNGGPGGEAGAKEFMETISPKRKTQYMQFGMDFIARAKARGVNFGMGGGR